MNHFTVTQPLPDVWHIQDVGQVCFTLIRGEKDTLLFDTGMGFYDVASCVAPYVRGKLHVVFSHAHYDHTCGQHYFAESFVHPDDLNRCRKTVDRRHRALTLKRARARGILEDAYPAEQFVNGTPETVKPLTEMSIDLGGLEVRFLLSPGHTKGSIVAYIEKKSLLLTGDTWNPHTWLFFPECQPLAVYTRTVRHLRNLQAEHVLRSHDASMVSMEQFRAYADGLSEETFSQAEPCPVPPYTHIHTYCCYPEPESKLVFNGDKR
ncbi:MAG: MBL fold metallo-hydrolase [Clostridiales bacterium]|nr:MBL fold metallo-hydrolase [Clostridiales bacterium]